VTVLAEQPAIPDLQGFVTRLGVRVCLIGEDADFAVALGHVEPRRALAAFNRHARRDLGWDDLLGGFAYHGASEALNAIKQGWAYLKTQCDDAPECGGPDADEEPCWECNEIREAGWWLGWGATVTAETPGAFPITYLA
jgi:hypothetical protein